MNRVWTVTCQRRTCSTHRPSVPSHPASVSPWSQGHSHITHTSTNSGVILTNTTSRIPSPYYRVVTLSSLWIETSTRHWFKGRVYFIFLTIDINSMKEKSNMDPHSLEICQQLLTDAFEAGVKHVISSLIPPLSTKEAWLVFSYYGCVCGKQLDWRERPSVCTCAQCCQLPLTNTQCLSAVRSDMRSPSPVSRSFCLG